MTGDNNGDFKGKDNISTKYKLNTAKYKGAIFRSDELARQPKIDYNIGSNKSTLEYDIISNESGLECDISYAKYKLEYNMISNKYRLDYNTGSNKFKIVARPDQNTILNLNISTKGYIIAKDKSFKVP